MNTPRNNPCPCGSGKKFKRCHGDSTRLSAENISATFVNHERKTVIAITNDIIVNQLSRDGPKIAKSFDKLTKDDISEISAVLASAMSLIVPHYMSGNLEDKGLGPTCARLVGHTISTFLASIEVARHGFRRQYGAMARGVVESLSTAVHLCIEPEALEKFYAGKLKSTDSITVAKRALPPLGPLYGLLSNHFVHVGIRHATFEPTIAYSSEDAALGFIVANLRGTAWLTYVVAELVLHEHVAVPRYWHRFEGGYAYDPSADERNWQQKFLIGPEEIQLKLKKLQQVRR